MEPASRHQCLIYKGSPAGHLRALAAVMRDKLREGHRCLYFDSPPMVAGMRSYLAASGVDVAAEIEKGSLVLSSDQPYLVNEHFDAERMLRALDDAVKQALSDGYTGLWATGDMTWEIGAEKDVMKLLEYEWELEHLFRRQPCLSGVCQYHADTLAAGSHTRRVAHASVDFHKSNPLAAKSALRPPSDPFQQSAIAGFGSSDRRTLRAG